MFQRVAQYRRAGLSAVCPRDFPRRCATRAPLSTAEPARSRAGGARAKRRRWGSAEGSALILILVYATLALLLTLVTSSATALALAQERLHTAADGIALAGTDGFVLSDAALDGETLRIVLREDLVRAEAERFSAILAADHPANAPLRITATAVENADTVRVEVSLLWRPPFIPAMIPSEIELRAEARARPATG